MTKHTTTSAAGPVFCEPRQIISDALSNLDKMCALFAYVDGDPELDHATDRAAFNRAAALVRTLISILRDEVTGLQSGARTMQTKRGGVAVNASEERRPTRAEVALTFDDARDALDPVTAPLCKLDEVVHELGVACFAAANVPGDIGVDLGLMLAQLRNRTRAIHHALLLESLEKPVR